jgi:hypothetical protein
MMKMVDRSGNGVGTGVLMRVLSVHGKGLP